jgi:hypothetical protein
MPAGKTPFDESQESLRPFLAALGEGRKGLLPPRRAGMNEKLWRLLPAIDAPYDYLILSKAEADALTEALSDGFNTYLGFPMYTKRNPLPTSVVKSRLLSHVFYSEQHLEYDADRWNTLFLGKYFDQFPLALNQQRLQIYFQNQFNRFRHQYESAIDLSKFDWRVALKWLYEKPWYEFHALSYLKHIQLLKERVISEMVETTEEAKRSSAIPYELEAEDLTSELIFLTGTFGRLVEQYFWRFQYEKAVATGEGARKGASAGGKATAELYRAKHSAWQKEALKIWANRPGLTKQRVAEIVRKQLREVHTAKHIARYIVRP